MDSLKANLNAVNQKLARLEDKYMTTKPVRVYCGTFNVNGKLPDEDMRPWLCVPCEDQKPIDIYAIGFQELVDLNTMSLFQPAEANEREAHWTRKLTADMTNEKNFKSRTKYRLVTQTRMFGLFLIVYANEKLFQKGSVQDVCTSYVATGIMDMVGNKGSVGVSLKINESRVVFVCSHLAADVGQLEKRNSDFRATRSRLKFYLDPNDLSRYLDVENDHDAVFWFGDLNYRLDNLDLKETFHLIYASEFNELLKYDQLSNERAKNRVFENYLEGKVNFRPTYKYMVKSDVYEKHAQAMSSLTPTRSASLTVNPLSANRESNLDANISIASSNSDESAVPTNLTVSVPQQRPTSPVRTKLPSWTDRVLYKTSLECKQLQYSSINTITISDHKPVYSIFELSVRKIDLKERQKVYDELLKESDRKVNEEMPRISVESFEFKFGDCMYYDAKTVYLSIKNDGVTKSTVDAFFFDNSRPAESSSKHSSQQWINIHPTRKERLEPNATYSLALTTAFNYRLLGRLNTTRKLDDFLILRSLNGNDLFISLNCVYKPTIIGVSLRALSTLNKPERGGGGEEVSFEKCNQVELIGSVEIKIDAYEKRMDELFREKLKECSSRLQKEHIEKIMNRMDMNNQKPTNSRSHDNLQTAQAPSKLDIFNQVLSEMKKELIDNDDFSLNDLSSEYKFFLEHLISRCTFNLENMLEENKTGEKEERAGSTSLTIEEQKNLALFYMSCKNHEDFLLANFDLELLAELLNDLLYALPQTLIPARYIDYCIYADHMYEKCLTLLIFLPRSHLILFELIVRFLQIYLKCLSTCQSNFNDVIAEAIFQTNKSGGATGESSTKAKAAHRFLKLFIDSHSRFLSI